MLTFNYGAKYFSNKVVLKVKSGGKSAIWPNWCCQVSKILSMGLTVKLDFEKNIFIFI